jgi:hypothetical protein
MTVALALVKTFMEFQSFSLSGDVAEFCSHSKDFSARCAKLLHRDNKQRSVYGHVDSAVRKSVYAFIGDSHCSSGSMMQAHLFLITATLPIPALVVLGTELTSQVSTCWNNY